MSGGSRRAPSRPRLRELAGRLGIIPEYIDQTGRHVRRTSDFTREVLLAVMGFDAPSEDAARGWLDELDHEAAHELIAPVRVVARDADAARRVPVRLPPGVPAADVELTVTEEVGHVWRVARRVDRQAGIELPTHLPYGYHTVSARARAANGGARGWTAAAEQSLIVVPSSCITPAQLLGGRGGPRGGGAMGIVANLYSVRREHDWGIGDFGTFTQLVEWAAARGADFVGVNPLHALYNRGWEISPYSPVSRLFRNVAYLDVEAVPELQHAPAARALLESPEVRSRIATLRADTHVDYDGVVALKMRVLAELHRVFRERSTSERSAVTAERAHAYADFVRQRDPELTRFATWMTIAEDAGIPDWRAWPAPLRDVDSAAVQAFRAAHGERIDFHRWLQFETHRQLGDVARRANVLGMRIGVYQDLAIGTSGGGSDTWSYPDLFVTGACIGAPPDPYSATGQNWGLPPIDPRTLRQQRYRYWIQLLRRAFEHSGALRIDHVMGLFRKFWIPDGGTGSDGAYVAQPAEDLLGILALESVRHDALVVGEDLGTVPPEVPPALTRWGILSSKVLYFERDAKGFRPPSRYPPLSLATANTHDMAPLAGFWAERDVELRAQVGLLPTARDVRAARAERAADKKALLRRVGLASPRSFQQANFPRRLAGAVHEFLCSTPAILVGLSLDDLIGEVNPVNVPGVGQDRYPSWRRKTRMTMEEISWSFEVDDAMRCRGRRGGA